MQKLEPVLNFTTDQSSILIHKGQAEVCINQNTYTGDGEVRLELLPRANIYFYGYFKGVSPEDSLSAALGESFGRSGVSSFFINGRQIKGFLLDSSGNMMRKNLI